MTLQTLDGRERIEAELNRVCINRAALVAQAEDIGREIAKLDTRMGGLEFALDALGSSGKCRHKPSEGNESPQAAGGRARAEKLSPERRSRIAKDAAVARWMGDVEIAK